MTIPQPAKSYRMRIYQAYVSAHDETLVPATLAAMALSLPYLRQLIAQCMPQASEAAVLELDCGSCGVDRRAVFSSNMLAVAHKDG